MEARDIVKAQPPCSFHFLLGTIIGQLEAAASRLGGETELTMLKNALVSGAIINTLLTDSDESQEPKEVGIVVGSH